MQKAGIAVVGAGAAGLMAAIGARRAAPTCRVVALDGAARIGAKIRIAGGGRCNVTHHVVSERDFNGSTPPAIRRILRAFDVDATRAFFADAGVTLVREDTGKLFPSTNRAADVVRALLDTAADAGVELHHPQKVTRVSKHADHGTFVVETTSDTWLVDAVILATGGRSVPATGSDGSGYAIATALGLPLTPHLDPALVPLDLADGSVLRTLAGLTTEAALTLVSSTGRHLHAARGSLLCTHRGLSGPVVLDMSRHWLAARRDDPGATLRASWLPDIDDAALDARLREPGARPIRRTLMPMPERLADALCREAGLEPTHSTADLTREARRRLVTTCTACPLPITGTRGFAVAEVTAGGVPLAALTSALEARHCPGLFVCGELCDVDGRIGGFNFQWAWASGHVAGRAAASSIKDLA